MAELSMYLKKEIIFAYGECHKDLNETVRVLVERHPNEDLSKFKVKRIINLFEDTGSVRELKRVREKPVTGNQEIVGAVVEAFEQNPTRSVRNISQVLDVQVSRSSIHRILKSKKFHPFKISLHQELSEDDMINRLNFCYFMLQTIEDDPDFIRRMLFSDESTFKSNSVVNRHNMRYWAIENPHWVRHVDNQRVWSHNVWGAVIGEHVIGPHFFYGNLNGAMYLLFLQNEFHNLIGHLPRILRNEMVFMQDGAPPHFARPVRAHLDTIFGPRWVGRGGPIPWPARSPDLTPCDYFLWGYVKTKVYSTPPTTPEDLQNRIREAFASINANMMRNVIDNFRIRLERCIEADGGTFEHLL